jgi:hypothetical protein
MGRIMSKERETVYWEETIYSNYLSLEAYTSGILPDKN